MDAKIFVAWASSTLRAMCYPAMPGPHCASRPLRAERHLMPGARKLLPPPLMPTPTSPPPWTPTAHASASAHPRRRRAGRKAPTAQPRAVVQIQLAPRPPPNARAGTSGRGTAKPGRGAKRALRSPPSHCRFAATRARVSDLLRTTRFDLQSWWHRGDSRLKTTYEHIVSGWRIWAVNKNCRAESRNNSPTLCTDFVYGVPRDQNRGTRPIQGVGNTSAEHLASELTNLYGAAGNTQINCPLADLVLKGVRIDARIRAQISPGRVTDDCDKEPSR